MANIKALMADIESRMAIIQPPMANIPSSYGENYFAMAEIVRVVAKVWRDRQRAT